MPRAITPEPTPNPNALRFSLGESLLGESSLSFAGAEDAAGTAWAEALFSIPGVESLFGVGNFVTVTKTTTAKWEAIVPHVVSVLQDAAF